MINENLPANVFALRQSEFRAIFGSPWVYHLSDNIRNLYRTSRRFTDMIFWKRGMSTGDNFRFIRNSWEIPIKSAVGKNENPKNICSFDRRWFPYFKGGDRVKWFGNNIHLINWFENGKELRNFYKPNGQMASYLRNSDCYFKMGITYNSVSSVGISARYMPEGCIFDQGSNAIFANGPSVLAVLGIINSITTPFFLSLNPTINIVKEDFDRIPYPKREVTNIDYHVLYAIQLQEFSTTQNEINPNFVYPFMVNKESHHIERLRSIEEEINQIVLKAYGIISKDIDLLNRDAMSLDIDDVDSNLSLDGLYDDMAKAFEPLLLQPQASFIAYDVGIVLGRFQPGTPGALGSAIYRRTDFAIGSLPEPTEEEFNELVGEPSQFAYIDEQGGRHVFSRQVEQALQKLTLPDGIAVFDPSHSRDLPTLVSKALELMLGQAQAQEVIQQAAGGDLRKFLEKDFFTQHHIKQYRKRPVYWPIQSSKRSYGFVLFHEKIDRNTFYALQQEPYLPTKRRAVQLRLEELGKKVLTAQGAARKPIEKEMDELRQLAEELAQFAKDLDAITRGGYEPEADWIDDGVILRMAPLWSVIPLWKSEPKKYWDELAAGKYDWSRIALKYWPERVKQACKKNKSYAIAHGHEEWYKGG